MEHAAETQTPAEGRESPAPRAVSWLLSLAVHAAVIAAAFFVVWSVRPAPRERAPVIASFELPAPAPAVREPAQQSPTSAQPAERTLRPPTPDPEPLPALNEPDPAPAPAVSDREIRERLKSMMQRRVPDVKFVGLGASNARDVVYVVDASGSMIGKMPGVLAELRRSVEALSSAQRFQVIFFGPNTGYAAARHPSDPVEGVKMIRLIRATRDNIQTVLSWAESVFPSGRSNPVPALETALALKPDAVFVLSTAITGLGQWEPDREALLAQVDRLNPADPRTGRRPAVIKTIQFREQDPAEILRAIGLAHGGEDGYTFIEESTRLERTPTDGSAR